MLVGIYNITNILDGTIYIGSSKHCEMRWNYHRVDLRANRHCNRKLQSAWNKYGEAAFEFRVLEQCKAEELFEREQYYLDLAESSSGVSTYNLSTIAKGSRMSPEAREALSKRMKGNTYTLGYVHTDEARLKMSQQRTGVPKNPASRENYRQAALKREAARRNIPELPYVEPDWLKRWKNETR